MRVLALAGSLALMGLAGCSAGPESYATMTTGVGFGDYQRYLRDRESTSSAPYSVPPESRQAPILPPATMPASAPSTLAAVPLRSLPAAPAAVPAAAPAVIATQTLAPVNSAPVAPPAVSAPLAAPMQIAAPQPAAPAASLTSPTLAAAAPAPQGGIVDAQTYRPHARSAAGAAPGPRPAEIVTVASVPPPSSQSGPNVVAYALSTSHPVGTELHRRINPLRWSRWENACLQYRNQDAAQEAFLANGGPQRDGDNLDPDGDGYACWWDPTPMRQAALASR